MLGLALLNILKEMQSSRFQAVKFTVACQRADLGFFQPNAK